MSSKPDEVSFQKVCLHQTQGTQGKSNQRLFFFSAGVKQPATQRVSRLTSWGTGQAVLQPGSA